MITDRESRLLTAQSSSSRLGAGFVLMAAGAGLVLLWSATAGTASLLLALGAVAEVVGVVLVAGALVRLAEKFEDIHRMTAAAHEARVGEEIRHLRERSS